MGRNFFLWKISIFRIDSDFISTSRNKNHENFTDKQRGYKKRRENIVSSNEFFEEIFRIDKRIEGEKTGRKIKFEDKMNFKQKRCWEHGYLKLLVVRECQVLNLRYFETYDIRISKEEITKCVLNFIYHFSEQSLFLISI